MLTGGLELSCTFADGSQAQSCILMICKMEYGVTEFCMNITISREESIVGQQVDNLQPGLYIIREMAEVESDGQLTIHRKQNVLELRVTEPPPSTTIPGLYIILAMLYNLIEVCLYILCRFIFIDQYSAN